MHTPNPSAWPLSRRLATLVVSLLLAVLAAILMAQSQSLAAPAADCLSGNFGGIYQEEDLTLSGDLYATSNVIIRNNVTVTLEAGTTVTMCGAYQIDVQGGGNLVAVGTETMPITVNADDPAVNWNRILFNGLANQSVLRHVVLNDGGGNDPLAAAGAVEFGSNLAANSLPSPTLDHVTINDSGAYGLYLQVNADDITPPSVSHVTINNSAAGAILANAQALGGLGSGNVYAGNSPNTIQVISGGASRLYHSQTWRKQDVPFEMLGTATVAAPGDPDPDPTLTIEAGTTFLMHPAASLQIGTSLGRGGSLIAAGTASAPVTFTRLDDVSAPWDSLRLSLYPETEADLQHVILEFGGSGGPAAIEQLGAGTLSLTSATVRNSQTAGLHAAGGVNIDDSTFEFNQTGLEFDFTADAIVRNSTIRNNLSAGLVSLDTGSNFTRHCIDAIGNYWGSPGGPADSYDQADACGDATTNPGGGDSVTGGVLYAPWLPGDSPLLDRGTIQPDPYYVIADGVDSAQVTITLRDALGNPLVGKEVRLDATVGHVSQPAQLTDAYGLATAVISATTPGFAYLSAYNLTDDAPVAGLGGVTFWQGSGDADGLIDPGGAPFASPQLALSGLPYQVGFPVGMRLPMQNSNPYPVDVEVVYGISGLAVGTRFAPVYTATNTLQPGQSWDATGVWLPTSSGHRCVQAAISASQASLIGVQSSLQEGTTTKQKNTNQDPCNPETLDPGNPFPKELGGLVHVFGWFYRVYTMAKKVNECLESTEQWPFLATANLARDYQQVVTVPLFDPPDIPAGGEITPPQAAALNDLAQTSADLLALNLALGATAQRLNWAAQAVGVAGSASAGVSPSVQNADQDLYYLDLQYQAYRDFANQYAGKLDLFADQIDVLLPLLAEADDPYMLAADFQRTRDELAANGFEAETQTFYEQTGLNGALITQLAQDVVASFDRQPVESARFSAILADIQASTRALADRLRAQYPAVGGIQARSAEASAVFVRPQTYTFQVGHPFTGEATVDLAVRPVSLPLGWTYELHPGSLTLGQGETATATLTLHPSTDLLEGDRVQVTVEGSVDGELIGGIQMDYLTPFLTPRPLNQLYLPLVVQQGNGER